jgi:hypothetical protein
MKRDYQTLGLSIAGLGLGLAIINYVNTKKYRETMLGLQLKRQDEFSGGLYFDEDDLGYEDEINSPYYDDDTTVSKISSFSESYADRGVDKIESLLQSDAFINTMREMGVDVKPEQLNKKLIKNILSAYGLFSLFVMAKNNFLKIGVISLNKDKIEMALNSAISDTNGLTV